MSHKAKPVRDHYTESLAINSKNLEKQLSILLVSRQEIQKIIESISLRYRDETDRIVHNCEKDIMNLENAPSPLRLFVDSIAQTKRSSSFSPAAAKLMMQYVSALEDWM